MCVWSQTFKPISLHWSYPTGNAAILEYLCISKKVFEEAENRVKGELQGMR